MKAARVSNQFILIIPSRALRNFERISKDLRSSHTQLMFPDSCKPVKLIGRLNLSSGFYFDFSFFVLFHHSWMMKEIRCHLIFGVGFYLEIPRCLFHANITKKNLLCCWTTVFPSAMWRHRRESSWFKLLHHCTTQNMELKGQLSLVCTLMGQNEYDVSNCFTNRLQELLIIFITAEQNEKSEQ